MAAKTKRKKSTQDYTCVDLFVGNALESGYHLSIPGQEETVVRISILQGQYSSTFIINRRREGISKNGVAWKKWEIWGTVVMSTRALNKAGEKKLNIYGKYRMKEKGESPWFSFRNITSYPEMIRQIVSARYIPAFNREIERLVVENVGHPGIDVEQYTALPQHRHKTTGLEPSLYAVHVAYPVTRTMDKELDRIPSGLTKHFRNETMIDAIRSMYGKKLYRKDLVKAASEAPLPLISIGLSLKGVVPVDWTINLFKNGSSVLRHGLGPTQLKAFRSLFQSLTVYQQKALLNALINGTPGKKADSWAVHDTLRMWDILKERYNAHFAPGQIEGKTWHEIHNNFDLDLRRRQVSDQPIKKVKLAEKIDEVVLPDGYRLIQPKSTHEMINWGKEMSHCIGSYTREALDGKSVFLGIVKNETLIGNAQISVKDKRLVQVFGKHNKVLDSHTLQLFSKGLIDNKVLPETAFKHAFGYRLQDTIREELDF